MTGHGPRVDAQPVREHVRDLMKAGGSLGAIADAAAVDLRMVRRLVEGTQGRGPSKLIEQFNADCLLRLTVDDLWACVSDTVFVDGTGTRRRVQALACEGWPLAVQGRHAGLTKQGMDYLLHSPTVRAGTARAFRVFYTWAQDQAPPVATTQDRRASTRTRTIARRKGWHSTWAWDSDTIDDPQAEPMAFARDQDTETKLGEDTEALIAGGMSVEWIADHFHVEIDSVQAALRRHRVRTANREQLAAAHEAGAHVDDIGQETGLRPGQVFGLLIGTLSTPDRLLTEQQRQIAQRSVDGLTPAEIARKLDITIGTAQWHLRKICGLFGVDSRADLAHVDLDADAPTPALEEDDERRSA